MPQGYAYRRVLAAAAAIGGLVLCLFAARRLLLSRPDDAGLTLSDLITEIAQGNPSAVDKAKAAADRDWPAAAPIRQRIALDMEGDQRAPHRIGTVDTLHLARSENRSRNNDATVSKMPPDLAQVAAAWQNLPEAVRAGIVAMILASGGR
jgi:hypothetical protein